MEDFPDEFVKPFLLSLDVLGRSNLQIFKCNSVWNKLRYFYIIPYVLVLFISISLYILRMFSNNNSLTELAFMVSMFLLVLQVLFKAAIIIPKKAKLASLIRRMGATWRTDNLNERQIKRKNCILKKLNSWTHVFYWGLMIPSWTNLVAPACLNLGKVLLGKETDFVLPIGTILPFDPIENWFHYAVVYVYQVYTMFSVIYIYIGTKLLMVTLCAMLSVDFALLRDDFTYVTPRSDGNQTEEGKLTIKDLIRKHQQLLLYVKMLDEIFNKMLFFDLLFITIISCFFGFRASVTHNLVELVNDFFAVLGLLLPTFIFCYYSEQLYEETAGIADAAYNNQWYHGNKSYKRIMCFVIHRAQMPTSLTSLGYIHVNLKTFSKVASTSWSYFSLLRSVYSEE